ncbi:hypothetical protein G6F56_010502 [Rhizopus delemar]|nr:hypothetical protein G6F56_010502 [Rhizopus delemar]
MSRNGEGSSNRIRGPTSALSSFLREQGIAIPNRSRRARREETQQETQAEDLSSSSSEVTSLVANTEQEEEEEEEETVTVTTRSAAKKRKKESDDEDDDDNNFTHAGPSSRKAVKGRARILFCNMCKSRFARNIETKEEDICESCKTGKVTQPKKVKRKRLNGVKKEPLVPYGKVPSLQDVCIEVNVEETVKLLSSYTPIQLQRRGLALVGLKVTGMRTGLGGKSLIDLELANPNVLPALFPAHKISTGDIVGIDVYKRDKPSKQSDYSGVVARVQESRITVALSQEELPAEIQERCQIVKLANSITYERKEM